MISFIKRFYKLKSKIIKTLFVVLINLNFLFKKILDKENNYRAHYQYKN